MAHANKRISIILAIVAFLFILTIILLIIPYEGTSQQDSPHSDSQRGKEETPISIPSSTTGKVTTSTSTSIPPVTTTNPKKSSSATFSSTTLQDKDKATSESSSPTTYTNMKMPSTQSSESEQDTRIIATDSSLESTPVLTEQTTFISRTYSSDSDQGTEITTTESHLEADQGTQSSDSSKDTRIITTDSYVESTPVSTEKTTFISRTYSSDSYQGTEFTTTESSVESTPLSTENNKFVSRTNSSDSYLGTEITTTESSVESTSVSTKKPVLMYPVLNPSISKTAASKQVAARMLHLMNHTVVPCQDFYEYSCGNGVDNQYLRPVNPKDAAMNRIKEAVISSNTTNQARVLYESCLDKTSPSEEERIDYIRKMVLNLGEIDPRPALAEQDRSTYEYIDAKPFNLTSVLATMMKYHFTPFFDLTLDIDNNNPSQFVLILTPPLFHSSLTENIRQNTCLKSYNQKIEEMSISDLDDLYEEYKTCSTVSGPGISAFTESAVNSIRKMNLLENITEVDPSFYRSKFEREIRFELAQKYAEYDSDFDESNILQLFPEPSDLRRSLINRDYIPYTLQQMDNGDGDFNLQFQNFSWHGLVEEVLEDKVDPATTLVQVYFPEEISKVIEKLNDLLGWDFQNLRNILLAMWSQYLDSNILEPVGHTHHTEEYCLHLVTELLPEVTTQLYLSSFDQATLKAQMNKVKDMENFVKTALKSQFNGKIGSSKQDIIQKIDSMNFDIGQNLVDGDLDFNSISPMVTLSKTDFSSNVIQLLRRSRHILYSFLDKNPNSTSIMWQHSNLLYSTSGFTLYPLNTVLIPIGSIESPFYDHGVPDIVNYAGLGTILSNEMMHAFDSTGIKFDFSSDASNIVTSAEICQKKQLNKVHKLKINDMSLNVSLPTDLIVNEALSDSSSVLLAWRAYLKSSTKDAKISETEYRPSMDGITNDLGTQVSEFHEENTSYDVEILPMMDLDTLQQFYIRSAQIHCEKSSHVNIMKLKENEHLPGPLRVNHMAKNDPLFKEAFGCKNDDPMIEEPQCPYIL